MSFDVFETVSSYFSAADLGFAREVRENGKGSGMWQRMEKKYKRSLSEKKGVSKEKEKEMTEGTQWRISCEFRTESCSNSACHEEVGKQRK
jgi:hypothetical protein